MNNAVIFPKKTIRHHGAEQPANLLEKKPVQIGLAEKSLTHFTERSYVILDFGRELAGGVRILTYRVSGEGKIRIRLGESLTECCSDIGTKNSTNDHSTRDFIAEIQDYSDLTFARSAFRFVRIDLVGDTVADIKSIVCQSEIFGKKFVGKFKSDDKRVNAVFDTAAYTLRLCLQNGMIWDGVKRDRLVWIGDMHPEVSSLTTLFGGLKNVENSLTFVKDQTPLPGWMNGFPTYSLWWILILHDYYVQNKNFDFLSRQADYLKGLVDLIDEKVGPDGRINFDFYFIDWQTSPSGEGDETDKINDLEAGVQALVLLSLRAAQEIFGFLGEKKDFIDGIIDRVARRGMTVRRFKQISALRVLAGIGDDNDKKIVLSGGANGFSTFMSYYILKAISDLGEYDLALETMKVYYGAMLDLGATTFWEDFDISWSENASRIDRFLKKGQIDVHGDRGAFCYKGFRHSLCHGWSSGAVTYLMRVVAGINVLSPGCEKIAINPHLSGLKHVKVVYPTPFGRLYVEHTVGSDGKVVTEVNAPEGVEIVR